MDSVNIENYKGNIRRSLLPEKKLAINFKIPESDKEAYGKVIEIGKDILSFVKNGRNLLIWSNMPGTGKTLMATKLGEAYIRKRCEIRPSTDTVLFINVADLLFMKKDFNNPESQEKALSIENSIKNYSLVIWDDIGVKSFSDYDRDYLTILLNSRLNSLSKSNIYTTNLNEEQLYEALGARLFSRIHEDAEVIEFKGGDKR